MRFYIFMYIILDPVSVRIVDGPTSYQGRLEVLYNGEWGTVSNSGFDRQDADIACRQLGYNGSAAVYTHGEGTGFVWLTDVNCNGIETSLDQCAHDGWVCNGCSHNSVVGIICAITRLCK